MESYKSTQKDNENNARMIIKTVDKVIEINAKAIEVELEQEYFNNPTYEEEEE